MHNRTHFAVASMLSAIPAPSYEIGVFSESGMRRIPAITAEQLSKRLSELGGFNSRGRNIFIQPEGDIRYSLLDDLTKDAVSKLYETGFNPCAVVQTSPGNFQAWLKHSIPLTQERATVASQLLAQRFHADLNATGCRRFGRLVGFTNRKPKHRQSNGLFPFVRLTDASGRTFRQAVEFQREISEVLLAQNGRTRPQRLISHEALSPRRGRRFSYLSLARFRDLPQYQGQMARADIAFSKAALATGMPVAGVAEALRGHYLSSNPSHARRESYIKRSIEKASFRRA